MKCMEYDPRTSSTTDEPISLPPKDDKWFAAIKWSSSCASCKAENGGSCLHRSCAEDTYDPWGDPFPLSLWYPGGNDVDKYLRKKAAKFNMPLKPKNIVDPTKRLYVTKEDWRLEPFSDSHVNFILSHNLTSEQVQALKFGYKPTSMEEKWFFYYEGGRLYFYRSWTGICMFVVTLNADSEEQYVTAYAYKQNSIDDLREFAISTLNDLLPRFARTNLPKLKYSQEQQEATW